MNRASRPPYLLLGFAAFAGLASALAFGFYLGSSATGAFHASLERQIVLGQAERYRVALARLDAGEHQRLRDELNVALDGALLSVCLRRTGGAEAQGDLEVVRRVAAQRRERPPTYPAGWIDHNDPSMATARQELAACLASVEAGSTGGTGSTGSTGAR